MNAKNTKTADMGTNIADFNKSTINSSTEAILLCC